ncbi:MAG: hypothetical protein GQ570_09155 [Helicobacteraceae bacterium]|nr:hypothetical protein [Helicobacteraceae bacterium]
MFTKKKIFSKKHVAIWVSLTALLFVGCDSNEKPVFSGKVIGSHYEGAKVFIDLNDNLLHNQDEPFTITAKDGSWTLANPETKVFNIVADISVGNTAYKFNSIPMMRKVTKPLKFIASTQSTGIDGQIMVSAISTMVYKEMKSSSTSLEIAQASVAKELGVEVFDMLNDFDVLERTEITDQLQFASNMETSELETSPVHESSSDDNTNSCKKKSGFFSFLKKGVSFVVKDPEVVAATSSQLVVLNDVEEDDDDIDPPEPDPADNPDHDYTCQLNTMIGIQENIEGNVTQINSELKVADSLLTDIYNQMIEDNEAKAQEQISKFLVAAKTTWQDFNDNFLPANSNLEFVKNCVSMKYISATNVFNNTSANDNNIFALITYVDTLLGSGLADDQIIQAMLSAKVTLESENKVTSTQGTKGDDIVTQMLQSGNSAFYIFMQIATALQQTYNLEAANALFIYSQINETMCSDDSIQLFIATDGIKIKDTLFDNITTLNQTYFARFKKLQELIIKYSGLHSDHMDNINPDLSDDVPSASSYAGVPNGDWTNEGTLFTPMILVGSDYNVTGYYDGVTLTSVNPYDRSSRTSLDLSDCLDPSTDAPTLMTYGTISNEINKTNQKLSCGWLNASKYSWLITKELGHTREPPYAWAHGIGEGDAYNTYIYPDSAFNTFYQGKTLIKNGDEEHKPVVDDKNNLKVASNSTKAQTIQFTSPNGEKALFQLGYKTKNNAASGASITCGSSGEGEYSNDDYSWTCTGVQYADKYLEKLHIGFPKTSGDRYTIYFGFHGKNVEKNRYANGYLDHCDLGDFSCAKKLYKDYNSYTLIPWVQ